MNMMSAINAPHTATGSANWDEALAEYRRLRAISDSMPSESEGEDEAVDAYCRAMDHLIDNVPAPNLAAVITKVELLKERFEGFEPMHTADTAVMDDLKRLATAPQAETLRDRYVAYKRTKAEWDAWMYATPEDQRSDEDDNALCMANSEALNAFLLTPAETLSELSMKLSVFNEEQIDDCWTMGRPITALLADDARKIALRSAV